MARKKTGPVCGECGQVRSSNDWDEYFKETLCNDCWIQLREVTPNYEDLD